MFCRKCNKDTTLVELLDKCIVAQSIKVKIIEDIKKPEYLYGIKNVSINPTRNSNVAYCCGKCGLVYENISDFEDLEKFLNSTTEEYSDYYEKEVKLKIKEEKEINDAVTSIFEESSISQEETPVAEEIECVGQIEGNVEDNRPVLKSIKIPIGKTWRLDEKVTSYEKITSYERK